MVRTPKRQGYDSEGGKQGGRKDPRLHQFGGVVLLSSKGNVHQRGKSKRSRKGKVLGGCAVFKEYGGGRGSTPRRNTEERGPDK